jgi:hypothetical protein
MRRHHALSARALRAVRPHALYAVHWSKRGLHRSWMCAPRRPPCSKARCQARTATPSAVQFAGTVPGKWGPHGPQTLCTVFGLVPARLHTFRSLTTWPKIKWICEASRLHAWRNVCRAPEASRLHAQDTCCALEASRLPNTSPTGQRNAPPSSKMATGARDLMIGRIVPDPPNR